jgi:dolichol-phosphate mannosyltransferase
MATAGYTVGFVDASELLTVRVYETATDAWTGWGRSLALSGVDPLLRQLGDLAVLAVAQALPLVRLLARRADVLDLVLGVLRLGTLFGTASAYRRRDAGFWLSPTADVLAVAAVGRGILTRQERWRGRSYARRWRSAAR